MRAVNNYFGLEFEQNINNIKCKRNVIKEMIRGKQNIEEFALKD